MDVGLISTAEAADLLGVTPQRVTQLIRNRQLEGTMIDGRWLVEIGLRSRRAARPCRRVVGGRTSGRPVARWRSCS